MALNAEDGKIRSEVLLRSDEGWALYVEALAKAGRLGQVAIQVRKRDGLLSGTPATTFTPPSLLAALPSTLSHSSKASESSTSPAPSTIPAAPASLLATPPAAAAGTPLSPIYVQIAPPTPQANAWKAIRYVLGLLLWFFVALTVLSMIMENTGLLKAGPGPAEFEPEEGRVVKFSDVHGVEEAKSVRRRILSR
jgi:ATP-dependent metalloprotease